MQNENTASSQTLRPRFRRIFRRFQFSADQQFSSNRCGSAAPANSDSPIAKAKAKIPVVFVNQSS